MDSPLKDFASGVMNEEDLVRAIASKSAQYADTTRAEVVEVLKRQLGTLHHKEQESLDALAAGASTVITGHQLMVCGGTAFFEIKILSAIALAKEATRISGNSVVPVFWMASEDHDFEEIASFQVNGQKFTWDIQNSQGPVGRLLTNSLSEQLETFLESAQLSVVQRDFLHRRLHHYQHQTNLASATRAIVREWAGHYGVLVIDGDDSQLKSLAQPLWDLELVGELSRHIKQTTEALKVKGYGAQVFPREINLFEISDTTRDRILATKSISAESISPNALMRPVYQEWILPNIAYVGGGGELAYWLQLTGVFESIKVPMPLLYLRDSVVAVPRKIIHTLSKLELPLEDVFIHSRSELERIHIESMGQFSSETQMLNAPLEQSINEWKSNIIKMYPDLAVHAEGMEKKFIQTIERSNITRYRAQKKKHTIWFGRLEKVFSSLYPENVFWERRASYADLLGILGEDPQKELVDNMSTIKAGTYVIYPEK